MDAVSWDVLREARGALGPEAGVSSQLPAPSQQCAPPSTCSHTSPPLLPAQRRCSSLSSEPQHFRGPVFPGVLRSKSDRPVRSHISSLRCLPSVFCYFYCTRTLSSLSDTSVRRGLVGFLGFIFSSHIDFFFPGKLSGCFPGPYSRSLLLSHHTLLGFMDSF